MADTYETSYQFRIDDLDSIVAKYTGGISFQLYTNDPTLTPALTPSSFTPVSFTGYADITIAPSDWDPAAYFPTPDQVQKAATNYSSWQPTSNSGLPVNVQGIMAYSGSTWLFAQRLGTIFTFVDTGTIFQYKPRLICGRLA